MQDNTPREPIINAPAVVIATLVVLALIHAIRQFIDPATEEWILLHFAFFPSRLGGASLSLPGPNWVAITTLFTHALLHGDWMHLFFNSVWLLVFGSIIAQRTSPGGFLALFIICAVAGGLAYLGANFYRTTPIIGASGAVSGMMGAAFRVIFSPSDLHSFAGMHANPRMLPRMPLLASLKERNIILAVVIWVGMNLLFAFGLPGFLSAGEIAWEAHLGGFFAGFLVFGLFDQGRTWQDPASFDRRSRQ